MKINQYCQIEIFHIEIFREFLVLLRLTESQFVKSTFDQMYDS